MNKTIYVICENEVNWSVDSILGVADSIESCQKIIKRHYGHHNVFSYEDIRDGGLEFRTIIQTTDNEKHYISVLDFNLNEI